MKRTLLIALAAVAVLIVAAAGVTLAADRSAAMEQHMQRMAENPGMERMMELMDAGNAGMERMMDAPPFHMPPVHP